MHKYKYLFYDIKYGQIIFSLKTNLFLKDIPNSYLNYWDDTDYHQHCIFSPFNVCKNRILRFKINLGIIFPFSLMLCILSVSNLLISDHVILAFLPSTDSSMQFCELGKPQRFHFYILDATQLKQFL